MKLFPIIIGSLLFFLSGCSGDEKLDKMKPLTNQQIAGQIDFCHSHGLGSWERANNHNETVVIQCYQLK